jgi:hypothetical protein
MLTGNTAPPKWPLRFWILRGYRSGCALGNHFSCFRERYLAGKTVHKGSVTATSRKRLKSSGRLHSQETCMSQRGLEALLRPKSIAVIGASMKPDRAGYLMMRNLLAGGFNGPVMPVTPAYKPFRGAGMA